ncbi:unnamed protein product [Microthlaspi erraticum]|uniref:F-box domain-containing protein n=1 Tax=Microthlaspi erraticum TaxID=1685480 RepID=A0A6D2HCV3_9BRAS|nr:unnamed protein product [Microthlaspi erraticum]CAA7033037.1 unnamed protein product [Microthlaspi erraticum]
MHVPDWTQLPEELLEFISEKLDNCFDVIHARSVCSLWRSTMPFPCSLLSPRYSLISFASLPYKCSATLKKIPLFLFRVLTLSGSASEYFLGGIGRRDEPEDHIEHPPPLQCSVKIPGSSDQTLVNMLDCQIIPMGHQYRIFDSNPSYYKVVAFLPLGGREFVVLLNYGGVLFVLTSVEMKWKLLEKPPRSTCSSLVTFRGRFYASFFNGTSVVIDPYSLDVTKLMHSPHQDIYNHLVPSGNDELFLVEQNGSQLTLRVSRLDEEAGKWVVVTHVGDRVLFISGGVFGNFCCSAKELPDGCGMSGNSMEFTDVVSGTYSYKYGVDTGRGEDGRKGWRPSRENRVKVLSTSPVVALRVEH